MHRQRARPAHKPIVIKIKILEYLVLFLILLVLFEKYVIDFYPLLNIGIFDHKLFEWNEYLSFLMGKTFPNINLIFFNFIVFNYKIITILGIQSYLIWTIPVWDGKLYERKKNHKKNRSGQWRWSVNNGFRGRENPDKKRSNKNKIKHQWSSSQSECSGVQNSF